MHWLVFAFVVIIVMLGALALFTALVTALVESAVPPIGKTIDVDGAAIRYLDEGSGPPIVLVHGLAGNLRHFSYALKDRLTPNHRVILLDRPGCGYSTTAPGALPRIRDQAKTIAAFIRALDLDRPLLVGHSFGGAIALAVALDHRETIGGLALIAPLSHATDDVPAAFRSLATLSPLRRAMTAWFLATPASVVAGAATLATIFGPDTPPPDFGKNGGGLLTLRPASFMAASAEMVLVNDDLPSMETRYATIDCPVGILYGTGDRLLDHRVHGEPLARKIEGATLELIPEAGHMPPIILPDRTAAFIEGVALRVAPSDPGR